MDDARRALLTDKSGMWEKYPANMLRWRATGCAADICFPDVIGGMKRSDELGADITPDGDVINATWTVKEPSKPQVQPSVMLNDLIIRYGATAILAINDNKIPQTVEEITAATKKLEAQAQEVEEITIEGVPEMKA